MTEQDKSYFDLKRLTDRAYKELELSGKFEPFSHKVIVLLSKNGIKLRQDNGKLNQFNISIPTSFSESIVVGLRYTKENGTRTEDLFLFKKNSPIVKGYKGKLEKRLTEYKDTHKLQR